MPLPDAPDRDPDPGATQRTGFGTNLTGAAGGGGNSGSWLGWKLRLLVCAALLGCLALFALARELAEPLHIDASWHWNADGTLQLAASPDPALRAQIGQALWSVQGLPNRDEPAGSVTFQPAEAPLWQRSPRWLIDDTQRERQQVLQHRLAALFAPPPAPALPLTLAFADGTQISVTPRPRGFAGLGAMFWGMAALALVLYLVTVVVVALAKPSTRNLLYAVMALCQTGNLLGIAVESVPALGLLPAYLEHAMAWRMALDLATAAAIVHSAAVHPLRLPGWRGAVGLAWGSVTLLNLLALQGELTQLWWWTQGGVFVLGALAIGLLTASYRLEPHPFALVLRRFGAITVGGWGLLSAAVALTAHSPGLQQQLAATGSVIWTVFLASLLLLVPFLSSSQQLLREFSLLALTSSVAFALDLLFAALFSFGPFASLTLALFAALALYAGARQWALGRLLGTRVLTTERMFEQLYRIAREVEAHPQRRAALLMQLMKNLFEPIEASLVARATVQARVMADGSTLLLPVPELEGGVSSSQNSSHNVAPNSAQGSTSTFDEAGPATSIKLRFAQRGRRLFTSEDARLADRIVEQLRRAVAFDRAVEQGRSEERLRLAQDLHDDIGARLLTLMYKAPSPEMEDYVRHTLQDLKTLTRGLADANHHLSHAAGEWKADLTHRLAAAHITLAWVFRHDESDDLLLNVVQWSGLTRVLRELVSNVIAHAQAQNVEISFALNDDELQLTVTDDGHGSDPQAWSHGLGLGGIRKRVKQLGGEVEWQRQVPQGIRCRVVIPHFSAPR